MKYKLKEAMNMNGVGERERVTQNNVINLFVLMNHLTMIFI